MEALIALCVSLLIGQAFSLLAFSEDSITPFVFTTHPNRKVKRDKNGEKEVTNGNNMRFSETVSVEIRPINEDPIEYAVIKYRCRSEPAVTHPAMAPMSPMVICMATATARFV